MSRERHVVVLESAAVTAGGGTTLFTAIRPGRFRVNKAELLLMRMQTTNQRYSACISLFIVSSSNTNPPIGWNSTGGTPKEIYGSNYDGLVWWQTVTWLNSEQAPPLTSGNSIVGSSVVGKYTTVGEPMRTFEMRPGDKLVCMSNAWTAAQSGGGFWMTVDYDFGDL